MDAAKNFGIVTVSTGYDAVATSIVLSAGHGAKLPDPVTEGEFNLVWFDSTNYASPANDPNVEIVRVTGPSGTGDTKTISRAQEGTAASTKNTAGATYKMVLGTTAKTITDIESEIDADIATHTALPNAHHNRDHAARHVTGGGDTIADVIAAGNSGLMSGADKTKLNGIESGAKDDQNASEVPNTPVGSIAATDVQAAINELDTEKESIATSHAARHVTGGGDTIADVIAAGNSGLMSGSDKTKLNGIATGADVTGDNPPQAHIHSTDEVEIEEIGTATHDDLQNFINLKSSGIMSGGTISDSGSGQIDVAEGTGLIKISDLAIATTKSFDWPLTENIALTDLQVNYVYIDYNAGSPQIAVTTDRDIIELYRQFILGRVYRNGNTLKTLNSGTYIINHDRNAHERLQYRGLQHAAGAAVSEVGTLNLSSTDGILYIGNNQVITTAKNTSVSDTITQWYHSGGAWTNSENAQINNTQYDNGTNLATLTANRYGVHWIFICGCSGDITSLFGQGDYTLAGAENASLPSSIPDSIDKLAILAAKVIVKKNASVFTSIVGAYETLFPVSTPANHNDLGGIQGGAVDDYYHLTSANRTDLTDGNETTLHKHAASGIVNTPAGDIAATDVQAAINELDTEKESTSTNHAARHVTGGGDTIANAAPAGNSGLMSGADKTKLDGIENNATADQTGAEIKAAYEAEANAYTDTKNTKLAGIAEGADVTGDNAPQAHDLDGHNSCTLAELSADISDDNVVGLAATQTLTNKTINMSEKPLAITCYNATGAEIAIRSICYISGDQSGTPQITKAQADAAANASKMLVVTQAAISNAASGLCTILGIIGGFSGLTAGAIQYLSDDTAGAREETATTTTGEIVRIIGYAISTTEIFFDPDKTYIENA